MNFLRSKYFQLLIIVLFTFLSYANILGNGFVIDDKVFILNWPTIKNLQGTKAFFKGDVPLGHEGVYRPLRGVIYAIDYYFFGENPFWYHLQSIFIHLFVTVFVYLIILQATSKQGVSFIASLLFGLHPIHTETIDYIAASLETWGSLFFFISFYCYIKTSTVRSNHLVASKTNKYFIASIVFAALAFFTYEMTLTLPILIVLYDLCFKKLKIVNFWLKAKSYLFYVGGALLYVFIRFVLLDITTRGPYLANSFYLTALTMTKVFVKYIFLVILPLSQANNHIISKGIEAFVYRGYRTEAIMNQSILNFDIIFSIGFILTVFLVAIFFFRKYPFLPFGIFWFFISLLPVSEIVPQGSILNEKFLYIPSFGFVFILASFFQRMILNKAIAKAGIVFFVILTGAYSFLTYTRNKDWHNEITLWSKDIAVNSSDNAYAYFARGEAYTLENNLDKAIEDYRKAYLINPSFAVAIASEARSYDRLGKIDLAIETYKQTIKVDPYFWEAHFNLGNIYSKQGKKDLAKEEYEKTLALNPDFAPAKQNRQALDSEDLKEEEINRERKTAPQKENGEITLNDLLSLPSLKSSGVILKRINSRFYGRFPRVSFSLPSEWRKEEENNQILVTDPQGVFMMFITTDIKEGNMTSEEYLSLHEESYGELDNQGLAAIPGFDITYVKIFKSDQTGSDKSMQKNQFFLFKDESVIQILVYPADSLYMREFDKIVISMKIEKSK